MQIDITKQLDQLRIIQDQFNTSNDPLERFALLTAMNHIAEKEIPIHGYWEKTYRNAMLRDKGANPDNDQ